MGTTNNWVQDGLNSYLALTRQGMDERRQEADIAAIQEAIRAGCSKKTTE